MATRAHRYCFQRTAALPGLPYAAGRRMRVLFKSLVLLLSVMATCKVMRWTSNPYLIPPQSVSSPTQYLVFHGPLALNYTLSRIRCEALGGDLADVDTMETFRYLHERLHDPAYIASFDGKTYTRDSLALYPGGAVALPEGGGFERMPSICEVPVMGSFGIDLSRYGRPADKTAEVGVVVPGNGTAEENDGEIQELLRRGFVQSNSKDPRFSGLSRQSEPIGVKAGAVQDSAREQLQASPTQTQTQSVTTVIIYGSIETDPALPCCRCCNAL